MSSGGFRIWGTSLHPELTWIPNCFTTEGPQHTNKLSCTEETPLRAESSHWHLIPSAARDLLGAVLEPILCEIQPSSVDRFDQLNLLRPRPPFDLTLPFEGRPRARRLLEVHHPCDVIPECKTRDLSEAMLMNSAKKISGYSGVQDTRAAGENVDKEAPRHDEVITRAIN